MRINKYIATCGVCSRRKAEEYIKDGKVFVNGVKVEEFSKDISNQDVVKVNGKVISLKEEKLYLMLNKPIGYVTTNFEQFSRPSTKDLIRVKTRVFPVGRLDMNTSGMLLYTNDGDFTNKLTHPSHSITKTYIVTIKGNALTDDVLEKLRHGVDIGGYVTKEAKVNKISDLEFEIVISEGKNRQIRRMCEALNLHIIKLKRVKIGNLELGDLKLGKYRVLNENDIKKIFES